MYLNFKFRRFIATLLLTLSTAPLAAGECVVTNPVYVEPPIIPPIAAASSEIGLFSDLLAAPNGTPLTVYGTELSGPLVVAGVAMTDCPSIDETVYEEPLGSIRLAKTTCWLNDLPLGETYVDAGSSTLLPLHIIQGNVQTVSSFDEFKTAMKDPMPGDIFLLKDFTADLTADGQVNGGSQILYMRTGEHDATPLNPIALLGYPGSPAKFVVDGLANGDRGMSLKNTGWTIANIDFHTYWNTIHLGGEARLIGNRIRGLAGEKRPAGTGSVTAGGTTRGGLIAGNIVFGGRSNWRFDHAIYISDCPVEKGWTVEWNHVVDNDFSRGPQVVINHQWPRCGKDEENKSVASHIIRNNVVDTSLNPGRCIGVSAFGWQSEFNSQPPGTMYVENNFLINCGYDGDEIDQFGDARQGAAIFDAHGNTVTRGNILYKSDGGIQVGNTTTLSNPKDFLPSLVTNNTFIDSTSYTIRTLLHEDIESLVTIENNVFE